MPDQTVTVNARDYRVPTRPTVVITIDGCDPATSRTAWRGA